MSLSYCLGDCGDSTSMYESQGASGGSVQRRIGGGVEWGGVSGALRSRSRAGRDRTRRGRKRALEETVMIT